MRATASSALTAASVAVGALLVAHCSFGINPDEGHFSCASVADCVNGQQCILQLDGTGLCYPSGECVPGNLQPCGAGATCVDAGCINCTDCTNPACAGASCVLDGGPQLCVLRLVLPDGGLSDAGLPDGGLSDGGPDDAGATSYVCDFP